MAEPTYRRGAAVLSAGIGTTGVITFSYFSLASHLLPESEYGGITLLWSAVFITVSVLYRPVEQLLSRTISDRDARGLTGNEHLRVAATIQLALGGLFAVAALLLRGLLQDELLGGSTTLYWILIVTVLAYAASYFARGVLAGHRRFGLYGGLVLMEASSRPLFALAVAVGIAEGQGAVALGMAAAPIVSLMVVPAAFVRWEGRGQRATGRAEPEPLPSAAGETGDLASAAGETGDLASAAGETGDSATALASTAGETGDPATALPAGKPSDFTLAHGAGFAFAVLLIMLCEQTFINAGPLLVKATEGARGAALAGFAFNVLLIARAPLQLFQAVQTSILPHLTRLRASGESDPFRRSVNLTLGAICGFAGVVALVMLVAGPFVMDLLFGREGDYERGGLVLVSLGMGLYLSAATLNQALLARARARESAACWVAAAVAFVAFLAVPLMDDRVLQVEVGFLGAALTLCALLYAQYRRG